MSSINLEKKVFTIPRLEINLFSPVLALFVTAGLSAWLYWTALVKPVSLPDFYAVPRMDSFYLFQQGTPALWRFSLAFVALNILYLLAYLAARQAKGRTAWFIVIGVSILVGVLLLYMAPFDSSDIFDNIVHGRILGQYHANPFVKVGADYYPWEPFVTYMGWRHSPAAYGPLWELLAGATASLLGYDIIQNVIAFKLLSAIFLVGSIGLMALILRKVAPRYALAGTLLLAWNPLILYEVWGNGHNDFSMLFWVLLAVLALAYNRYSLAVVALVFGMLFKYIPVLFIPAAGIIALVQLKDWRARLRFLVLTGLASIALIVLSYAPFWEGTKTLTIDRRMHLFSDTLPATLINYLIPKWGIDKAASRVGLAAFGLTILFALAQVLWAGKGKPWKRFALSAFYVTAFYLLFTNLWYQQWYVAWLLVLAPLLPGRLRNLALLFGFVALSKQFAIGPYLFWKGARFHQPLLELVFTLGSYGLPLAYAIYALAASVVKPGWNPRAALAGSIERLETGLAEFRSAPGGLALVFARSVPLLKERMNTREGRFKE